ncbi:MAG: hypothetical protein WBA39_25355 [Rivularia sp. (in: cyanobacteria)]
MRIIIKTRKESSTLNPLNTLKISHNRLRSSMVDELSKLKCRVIANEQDYYDICIE